VVSCVVYASKFKPNGPEAMSGMSGPSMPLQPITESGKIQVAGLIGTTLGIGNSRKGPRESTTDADDWVWLGMFT
jgi:transmembrane protein 132